MAEVVHVFEPRVYVANVPYQARVVARPNGYMWEGWIEFVTDDESIVLRTPRETTQPDRAALVYWATGLSPTYLEGAMVRAMEPPPRRGAEPLPEPFFDAPAGETTGRHTAAYAVLDPFSVGVNGEDLLRRELSALADRHLRNIVRAYGLAPFALDLEQLSRAELIEIIVAAVQPA